MKKLSTLFKKDPEDMGRVLNEIDPENIWVLTEGMPTRKWDGTACAIIGGLLYKRYDLKAGRSLPTTNAIPCQEPDLITGHQPHWILCDRPDPSNKWLWQGFDFLKAVNGDVEDGTYELCGEKINGNPEKIIVPKA